MKWYAGVFLILCLSCSTHINEVDGKGLYVINLDSAAQNSANIFQYSSLYKGIRTVMLETSKSCLIGSISKMRICDGNIYILDSHIAKSLYVFDMDGRFIKKIGSVGQGPGEYIEPRDFTIDTENKVIYLLDASSQRINKYSLITGNFTNSLIVKNIKIRHIEYVEGKLYADAFFPNHSDNNYLLCSIREASGIVDGRYLNVVKYNKGFSNTTFVEDKVFFLRGNGNIVFVQRFMDHIIEINRDSIFPLFTIESKDVFTPKDLKEISEKGISIPEIFRQDKFHKISDYIEHDNWVMFNCIKGRRSLNVLFNKNTREVNLIGGGRWYDLLYREPITSNSHFINIRIGCFDKNGVYYYVSTEEISKIKVLAQSDVFVPDLDKLESLKKLDDDANPILFYHEFK